MCNAVCLCNALCNALCLCNALRNAWSIHYTIPHRNPYRHTLIDLCIRRNEPLPIRLRNRNGGGYHMRPTSFHVSFVTADYPAFGEGMPTKGGVQVRAPP